MENLCVRKEGANSSEARKAEFTGFEGRRGSARVLAKVTGAGHLP